MNLNMRAMDLKTGNGNNSMKVIVSALLLTAVFGVIWGPAVLAQEGDQAAQETERAKDPVCNINVRRNPELSVQYKGKTYYFCMKADMEAFKKDPEKYLQGSDHTHPDPKA